MKIAHPPDQLLRIDLTAMIDVIFLLLIFWMTVAQLAGAGEATALDTPVTDAPQPIEIPPDVLVIELAADSQNVVVGGRLIEQQQLLDALSMGPRPKHVLLRAQASVDAADVQTLLGALRQAGIERVGLAVRRKHE